MNYQVDNFLNIIKYAIHGSDSQELPTLSEPVDWEAMGKLAMAHNLFALFHEVAYKFPEYRESPEYEKNTQIAMVIVAQQIQRTETFLELYRAFLKEDLHPIVMKGIICRQLYGQYAEHRPSGDEDILVKKEEFYKVKAVMEKCGYECELEEVTEAQFAQMQHLVFMEKKSQFLIEVHANVMGYRNEIRTKMSNCFVESFEHAREEVVDNMPIRTFSHTEHLLFLILHAFRHFAEGGVGVRQMLDILLYQEQHENEIEWEMLKSMLKENCVDKYLGDMQYIGNKYWGFDFNIRLETGDPDTLLDDMIEVGAFGKKERADIVAANITIGALDKKKTSIGSLLRMGFPPKNEMLDLAPYLEDKPWLLPIEWIKRWGRFLGRARKYDGNLMKDSLEKSQKRIKLLKKYGL